MSKYVITDPCYILDEEAWQNCCKCAGNKDTFDIQKFNKAVKTELELLSGSKAWTESTGYGDWTNYIEGPDKFIIQSDFTADAGQVCVCKLTRAVEDQLYKTFPVNSTPCVAIIECDGDISVEFDKSNKSWTVINIDTSVGKFNSSLG